MVQQLNADLEESQTKLSKLKDKLMDQIQPLNELNERVVGTDEIEGIKEQMIEP